MLTQSAWQSAQQQQLNFDEIDELKDIEEVVFPAYPDLVDPRDLKRRRLGSEAGRIALLHAVAHIECYAIYLAWDMIYRFRGQSQQFYLDWLSVAADEALHFTLLSQRLLELGSEYGALPAHKGLWVVAVDTSDDLLARLALVPRYMEARGLDVTPSMVERLKQHGDTTSAAILQRIVDDEVAHVRYGSEWFTYFCKQRTLEPEQAYFDCLKRYLQGVVRGPFNYPLRSAAGFTEAELQRLEQLTAAAQDA